MAVDERNGQMAMSTRVSSAKAFGTAKAQCVTKTLGYRLETGWTTDFTEEAASNFQMARCTQVSYKTELYMVEGSFSTLVGSSLWAAGRME
jgi:hypothetical protein